MLIHMKSSFQHLRANMKTRSGASPCCFGTGEVASRVNRLSRRRWALGWNVLERKSWQYRHPAENLWRVGFRWSFQAMQKKTKLKKVRSFVREHFLTCWHQGGWNWFQRLRHIGKTGRRDVFFSLCTLFFWPFGPKCCTDWPKFGPCSACRVCGNGGLPGFIRSPNSLGGPQGSHFGLESHFRWRHPKNQEVAWLCMVL